MMTVPSHLEEVLRHQILLRRDQMFRKPLVLVIVDETRQVAHPAVVIQFWYGQNKESL